MKIFHSAIILCFSMLCINSSTAAGPDLICEESPIYVADLRGKKIESEIISHKEFTVVELDSEPTERLSADCSAQGAVRITFPPAVKGVQKYRLKFTMETNSAVSGRIFHIGDAQDNTGDGGSNTVSHSAEVFNVNSDWFVNTAVQISSPPQAYNYDHIPGVITGTVTVTIGDEYIELKNDAGLIEIYQGDLFFALRGQSVHLGTGLADYDVTFAMNRLISAPTTNKVIPSGKGLCNVKISALKNCVVNDSDDSDVGLGAEKHE